MLGHAEVHHLGLAVPGQDDAGTTEAVFSPDGYPIYCLRFRRVRPHGSVPAILPEPGPETQVSIVGGLGPVWNPRGGDLFYQGRDAIMAVQVANGTPLGPSIRLFDHARGEFLITWNKIGTATIIVD